MKGTMLTVRPHIADRLDLDIVRIQRTDKNAAFIARPNHAHSDRFVDGGPVTEVHRSQTGTRCNTGQSDTFEEVATRNTQCLIIIVAANLFLFGIQARHTR